MDNTIFGNVAEITVSPSPEMKAWLSDILLYFTLISLGLIVLKFALSKI